MDIKKIINNKNKTIRDIIGLIKYLEIDKEYIYKTADNIRKINFGDTVYIRGIIEFSNHCIKSCNYCGIRKENNKIERYRMDKNEILKTCKQIEKYGYSTVVLQSGEDFFWTKEKIGDLLKTIKYETKLAITLSLGERNEETYKYWKKCGMDRYLIRFETSNKKKFKNLHPNDNYENRINCIKTLKKIGVQTGSGFMIGLPDTNYEDIAEDIYLCKKLNLDMIGVGPFISHPETPLNNIINPYNIDFLTGIISILRIVNPKAHIPATTAFDAIHPNGRQLVLQRGANIFMPNSTPKKYRKNYLLYPGKPCVDESASDCSRCIVYRLKSINRVIGKGPGHSIL